MKKTFSSRPTIDKLMKRLARWGALALIISLSMFLGYWLGYDQVSDELRQEREQTTELIRKLKTIAQVDENAVSSKETHQQDEIRELRKQLQKVLERERVKDEAVRAQHEYAPQDRTAPPPPAVAKRVPKPAGAEPRLVIIIDDVSYARDIRAIESTGLVLTMSFLPPSSRHPDSAALAQGMKHYMVHLPLEAVGYDHEEPETLRIGDTAETMKERIEVLKKLYPAARYMNNHTGSKFTADAGAMERLMGVLKDEGIQFVDSRTTAQTKAMEASEKYALPYIGRDVFLDHQDGVENVKKQIALAVTKAKKYGTAIAIGHPRTDTIKALRESKALLDEVQLIRIDQM